MRRFQCVPSPLFKASATCKPELVLTSVNLGAELALSWLAQGTAPITNLVRAIRRGDATHVAVCHVTVGK